MMGTTAGLRRSLFGYRRRDVDGAIAERETRIAECEARIGQLDQVSAWLAERVVERERELRKARAELSSARERGDESLRALSALADDLETIRRQARGQATRMRLRALREAAEVAGRTGKLGDQPSEVGEALIESLREAVERVGAEADEEAGDPLGLMPGANGSGEREPGELFEGMVEVEVGPLRDFSQLVGFEDAAGGIGATSEVSVTRFTQGRATLTMRFKHPVELLRELEERTPFEFKVRDTRADRVVLDVDG
jgi:hypothetical protein